MSPAHRKKLGIREKWGLILPTLPLVYRRGRRSSSVTDDRADNEVQLGAATPLTLASKSPHTVVVPEEAAAALERIEPTGRIAS
jgi:hypothetical protein